MKNPTLAITEQQAAAMVAAADGAERRLPPADVAEAWSLCADLDAAERTIELKDAEIARLKECAHYAEGVAAANIKRADEIEADRLSVWSQLQVCGRQRATAEATADILLAALKELLSAGILNPTGSAHLGTAIEYARIAVAKAEGQS